MNTKDLIALGLTEETAAKVEELHKAEISKAEEKTAAAEKKLEAAETSVKDLTAKLRTFDGVDVEKLKSDVSTWEKKYAEDMAAARIDSALELALTKAGAKDTALAKHLIDKSIIKEEGGKLMGLDEQLTKIKAEKSWLFGEDKKPAAQLPDVSTGAEMSKPASDNAPLTLSGALREHYNK
ncbi:MAG: phage scaffolding protein [Oscillospiraceae bacterium]|nr:phage scaffolding protein [Oscillospiraceae bacterium]